MMQKIDRLVMLKYIHRIIFQAHLLINGIQKGNELYDVYEV